MAFGALETFTNTTASEQSPTILSAGTGPTTTPMRPGNPPTDDPPIRSKVTLASSVLPGTTSISERAHRVVMQEPTRAQPTTMRYWSLRAGQSQW